MDLFEEEEEKPKRRARKKDKPLDGKVASDEFSTNLDKLSDESLVSSETLFNLLVSSMETAYLEHAYPGLFNNKNKDSADDTDRKLIKCEVEFNSRKTRFKIYDIKQVFAEEDIIDDAWQISLEDALEYNKKAKIGDTIRVPFTNLAELDKHFARRVKQLFQARVKEASKQAVLDRYAPYIGKIIEGKVVISGNGDTSRGYDVNFGYKVMGTLRNRDLIKGDKFENGDIVKVYLNSIIEKDNPPKLNITRSTDKFLLKLIEETIPEVKDGIVKIHGIARNPGVRSKVFVSSTVEYIDPIGSCIGNESSRLHTIMHNLAGEKVEFLRYSESKAMQIIEAMKPGEVTALECPDSFLDPSVNFSELEKDPDYEYPEVKAIVNNNGQGVAIGSGGINVSLASRLTKTTITVVQIDQAIADKVKMHSVQEINKMLGNTLPEETEVEDTDEDIYEEENENISEPSTEETTVVEENNAPETVETCETVEAEETKEAEADPMSTTSQLKNKEVEHVEITNSPKISLKTIEEAMSAQKSASNSGTSFKKKKEKETVAKPTITNAMPIYTNEELEDMENDEYIDEDEDDNSEKAYELAEELGYGEE